MLDRIDIAAAKAGRAPPTFASDGPAKKRSPPSSTDGQRALRDWIRSEMVNAARHASSVRDFDRRDFGDGPAAPKEPNVRAVNGLLKNVARGQTDVLERLIDVGRVTLRAPDRSRLDRFARLKDLVSARTRLTERIWLFYENLFGQRTGPFAQKLLAMDRIALDCYQSCYMGLGKARSIPSPPPMAYIEAGYGPATYRRGVRLTKLGKRANPFPLVKLPHHRLINPWSLGAVPHEIGHNLQNDLSLWPVMPGLIGKRLQDLDIPPDVIAIWKRWHKEIYADLIGVLLIGPSYVNSLLDVVGKSPDRVARFNPKGVHPTSFLRPLINTALLKRIGFRPEAEAFERGWRALYPKDVVRALPRMLWSTFDRAVGGTVEAICFQPHAAYGNKALADVVRFRRQDLAIVREAADRLAAGDNPGIVPERFLICASRDALQRNVAPPSRIAKHFYTALNGR